MPGDDARSAERGWVFGKIKEQGEWRSKCLNMIASENFASPWVEKAYISDFMHRYAEGTPFNRYYEGTRVIDELEDKANKLFARVLGSKKSDTRPISGAIANMATMRAFTEPGDTIVSLPVPAGAHSSHGRGGVAGLLGLQPKKLAFKNREFTIDVEESSRIIRECKPKLAIVGASLILFPLDISGLKEACEEVGAKLIYDSAHVFGLIFAGRFQSPFKEGADLLTTSTHKTFPGPQGGLIAGSVNEEDWAKVERGVFPRILSNHHLHRIPALLVAAYEMQEFGVAYADQIIKNARAFAQALHERGFKVCAEERGFTECHQVVVDVSEIGGGDWAAKALDRANIIMNKNLLPWDELNLERLTNPSGIRMGVQEMTRFGMKEREMVEVAEFYKRVLMDKEAPEKVKGDVENFRSQFQKIHFTWDLRDLEGIE
ncbi:MAG TPA: serine hydroxymethyltransferase [archaeon]|nr:serine hydroxymethyltransferase [archaeon]